MQRLKQAKATKNVICMHVLLRCTPYYYYSCLCYFARWKSWRMGIIFITYIFLAFCRKWRHLFESAAAHKVNLLFFFHFRPSRSSSDAGLAVHQGIYQVIYIPSSTILGCTLIGVRCTSWAPALPCKQLTPYVHAPRCSATFLKWKSDFYAVMIRLACTIHCLLTYLHTSQLRFMSFRIFYNSASHTAVLAVLLKRLVPILIFRNWISSLSRLESS